MNIFVRTFLCLAKGGGADGADYHSLTVGNASKPDPCIFSFYTDLVYMCLPSHSCFLAAITVYTFHKKKKKFSSLLGVIFSPLNASEPIFPNLQSIKESS